MRTISLLLLPVFAGCSYLPGLQEPKISIAPRFEFVDMKGRARMQSASGGQIKNNASVRVEDFGLGQRETSGGFMISAGDGFSGLDMGFLRFNMTTSQHQLLPADFGNLRQGDNVKGKFSGAEYRFRYIAQVFTTRLGREDEVELTLGLGGMIAHRDLTLRVREQSGARVQRVRMADDGVPYFSGRLGLRYQEFGLRLDYGINPNTTFGGDFDGTLQDIELMGTYSLEEQDLTLFVGFRRQELPASGTQGAFQFQTDFTIDGVVVGFDFTF